MEYVNSLVAAAAAAEDGSPLLPAMYDIVWSAITFVIILFVVVKIALPRYNTLADERAMKLQGGLDATTKAHEESQKAESRIAVGLTKAKTEAAKIRDQAVAQAEDIVAHARARVKQGVKRTVETTQRQIKTERVAAEQSLRAEVGGLATQLAEKIVGEQLKGEALSARVVDHFLDELSKRVATVQAVGLRGKSSIRASSVRTLATMVMAADKTLDRTPETSGSKVAEKFFALSNLFDSDIRLARNLTDPARTPGGKQALVTEIFTREPSAPLLGAMCVGAAGRWSSEADLSETYHLLGKHILLKTASDSGKLDQMERDAFAVGQITAKNHDLRNFLTGQHRAPATQRIAAFDKLVGFQMDVLSSHLVNTVIERVQPRRISAGIRTVLESAAQIRFRTMVTIYVAKPLNETQHTRLVNLLSKQTGHNMVVSMVIDPLVVDGLKIQRGDIVIDGAVSAKVKQFRRQLVS